MSEKNMYLKPNVVFEPLIGRWYAWTHLIFPPTSAMNIVGRHLAIIDSYISAPNVHAQAVANPKMLGGPFMDLEGNRSADVMALREWTTEKQAGLLEMAAAIEELDHMLLRECKGFGLEDIYEKIPGILKGYVELYYDRNNNPGFRFFEHLVYKSRFYDKSHQSIAFWITNNDHRPFCLSTPRLETPDVLHLEIPFDHPAIDKMARMRREPGSVAEIKKMLHILPEQEAFFDTLFTSEPPPPYSRYTGDKIRMRYFGHACILIETKDVSILVDPLISYYGYHTDVEHFSDVDLPDVIDYVLITHNHQDHILFETLLPLRHKIKHIIVPNTNSGKLEDPSLKLIFNNVGFHNVIALEEMESISFGDVTITGLPFTGEHSDLNIVTKLCHHVQIGAFKLLFLADSRILEPKLYEHIQQETGDVDVMFLGMECDGAPLTWLYGPLMTQKITREQDGSRRLSGSDCKRGISLVDIFNPKEVYVYAMGQEPWVEFVSSVRYTDESNPIVQSNRLVNICEQRGIIAERLYGEKELLYEMQPETV
ncbi:MAG: MBL fold metallo-hydrolase [Dinghuibacter sp.]|nr:MBL fold metallo-hydrolase [Dinghuibacter sp.]